MNTTVYLAPNYTAKAHRNYTSKQNYYKIRCKRVTSVIFSGIVVIHKKNTYKRTANSLSIYQMVKSIKFEICSLHHLLRKRKYTMLFPPSVGKVIIAPPPIALEKAPGYLKQGFALLSAKDYRPPSRVQ